MKLGSVSAQNCFIGCEKAKKSVCLCLDFFQRSIGQIGIEHRFAVVGNV